MPLLHALGRDLAGLRISNSETNVLAVLADGRARTVGELGDATGTRPSDADQRPGPARGPRVRGAGGGSGRPAVVRGAGSPPMAPRLRRWPAAAVRHLEETALTGVSDRQLAGFRAVLDALTEASR